MAWLISGLLPGCGPRGPQRYELSGSVTYAGQPVPAGYVVFAPDAALSAGGPGSQADILDGQYRVPAEQGVVGGPYVATVYGFDGVRSEENGIVNALGSPIIAGHRVEIEFPRAPSTFDLEIPRAIPQPQHGR